MKNFKNLTPTDYWKIIMHRKWYAIGTFILAACGCIVYSLITPDVYRSTAMLQVETAPIPKDYVRPSDISTPKEQIAAVNQLIQSRNFVERLIQEFQIFEYGTEVNFLMDNAVQAVRNNIQVVSTSHNTFTISYFAAEPQLAQSITRRIVDLLIQTSTSSRQDRAVEADQFIDQQLRKTEQDLAAKEEEIKKFKSTHIGWLPEQSAANVNALSALKKQLLDLEEELQNALSQQKLLEARARQQEQLSLLTQNMMSEEYIMDITTTDGISGYMDPVLSAKETELAALSSRYTSNHPDVVRAAKEVEDIKKRLSKESEGNALPELLPEEVFTALGEETEAPRSEAEAPLNIENAGINIEEEMIRDQIAKIKNRQQAVLNEIKAYESRLNLLPQVELELDSLVRDREQLERQYRNLQDNKFQAQMTASLETNRSSDTYRIIDEANLPEKPAFPNRVQIAFMGFGLAIAVGIGAAFGRELLDSTLTSEEEAAKVLNIPVLVSVYEISKKKSGKSRKVHLAKSA